MNRAVRSRPSTVPATEDAELAEVLEHYLAALEAGAAPSAAELIASHPALADRLERCLASLQFVEGAASEMILPPDLLNGADEDRRLGDYRLLREIGRGGMGVVYEAEQISLARRVALKVLPLAAMLDPRQLQRFHNEALAAANLDHPHIVDVHGVGCERGVHFYVMRYIRGATLAEVVEARKAQGTPGEVVGDKKADAGRSLGLTSWLTADEPAVPDSALFTHHSSLSDTSLVVQAALSTVNEVSSKDRFRRIAEIGIQAAEALEHAHQLGVVHRDVKPSNLLVDDRGKLWVTDFGLAQVESNATLTLPGDVLGTLRYMSPEQAAGRPTMIDHRTDIYSLGATLYELATERPVVQAQERAAILREIAEQDPADPRTLNPALPRDLETILLKCLAKEPAARYDTAQALADDLRRFLEAKPVVARRPTLWDRAAKWSRRHQAALLITTLLLAAVSIGTTYAALSVAAAQRVAETANAKVEASNRLAKQAVDEMYTGFAKQWLAEQPQLTKVQASFLDKAASFYEALAAQSPADDATEYDLAKLLLEVADIRRRLGDVPRAKEAAERSLAMAERLRERDPDTKKYRNLAASGWNMLGAIYLDRGDRQAAETACQTAVDEFELLVRSDPSHESWRFNLATTRQDLGSMCFHAGRPREGYEHLQKAVEGYRGLVHDHPEKSGYGDDLARALINLASTACGIDELEEGAAAYDEAIELLRGRVDRGGAEAETRSLLAGVLYTSVQFLGPNGLLPQDEALVRLNRCMEMQQALVIEFPDVPMYQSRLKSSRRLLSKMRAGTEPNAP